MRGIVALLSAAVLTAAFCTAPAAARVAVTSVTAGEPRGQPPAETERVLKVGVDVQANERVTTRADDRAHLVFLDGTSLSVGPNSVLVIDKFVFDADRKTGEMAITATRGVFRFVGGAISKTSEVQIKTPSSTIGIRGGIATFSVSDAGATTANFLHGNSMTVTAQGKTQTATRIGSQISTLPGRGPAPPGILPRGALMNDNSFEQQPTVKQATPAQQQLVNQPMVNQPMINQTIIQPGEGAGQIAPSGQIADRARMVAGEGGPGNAAIQVVPKLTPLIVSIADSLQNSKFSDLNSGPVTRTVAAPPQGVSNKINKAGAAPAGPQRGPPLPSILKPQPGRPPMGSPIPNQGAKQAITMVPRQVVTPPHRRSASDY